MPFFTTTSAMPSRSSYEYANPDGFDGLFNTMALVFFVIALSSFSGLILKPSDSFVSRITGVAPARITISG